MPIGQEARRPIMAQPGKSITMPVTVLCPRLTCRVALRVPDSVRGQRVRCGECGTTFMVPPATGAAPKKNTSPPTPAKETTAAKGS